MGPAALLWLVPTATAALLVWHGTNRLPLGHDGLTHFQTMLRYVVALREGWGAVFDLLREPVVRYTPLAYVVAAVVARWVHDAAWMAALTGVGFWLVTAAALAWIGMTFDRARAALPLAAFVANPVTWTVATACNLEGAVVAGAVVTLALMLAAERIQSRVALPAAMALVAALALTKAVLFLVVVPAGLVWSFVGPAEVKRRRQWLLLAYLAAFLAWTLPRAGAVGGELGNDWFGLYTHERFGAFYYVGMTAWGYRGLPLLVALAVVVGVRGRRRAWSVDDAALAAAFVVPLAFFSLLAVKRPWYPLAGFMALPLWLALATGRDATEGRARWIADVTAWFYGAAALVTVTAVAASPAWLNAKSARWFGVERPAPPTADERAMVATVVRTTRDEPDARVAVRVEATVEANVRFQTLLYAEHPCLATYPQVSCGGATLDFLPALLRATYFYTRGETFPATEDFTGFFAWAETPEAFAQMVERAREEFLLDATMTLPDGGAFARWRNRRAERTRTTFAIPRPCRGVEIEEVGAAEVADWKREGWDDFAAGRYDAAAERFAAAHDAAPEDEETTLWLAKAVTMAESPERALAGWTAYFAQARVLGMATEALGWLGEREGEGRVPAGSFAAFAEALLTRFEAEPGGGYAVLRVEQGRAERAGDWAVALATIRRMTPYLTPEQEPGVRLSEANALARLDQVAAARALLDGEIARLAKDDPRRADAALQGARLATDAGDIAGAVAALHRAAEGPFPADTLALAVMNAAARAKDGREANALLDWGIARVEGAPRGLLTIERGKRLLAEGDAAGARAAFVTARDLVTDPGLRAWAEETIAAIDRGQTIGAKEGE